jgi:hypothetical protein
MNVNNDRPWMTAIEMQFATLKFAAATGHQPANNLSHEHNRPRRVAALKHAEAYAWAPDIGRL